MDYLGLADSLKRALATYTASGGRGQATLDQNEAVAVMKEKYEVVRDLLHGFDYHPLLTTSTADRMTGIAQAMEFILGLECQWPIILTPFRPIKLTHLGRQKSALAFVLQSIALSSQHEDV